MNTFFIIVSIIITLIAIIATFGHDIKNRKKKFIIADVILSCFMVVLDVGFIMSLLLDNSQ